MAQPQEEARRVVKHWYLGDTLGKGGFAFVKEGTHTETGRKFALKFIEKPESFSEENLAEVKQEISAMRRVKHTNVMRVLAYDCTCEYPNPDGTTKNTVLIVMPLCKNGTLFDILYYRRARTPQVICRTYFRQLCEGIKALHEAGITHRDIKPQNLLLDEKFRLKIADFGLSSLGQHHAKYQVMSTRVGTRGFQAPEIVQGRNYTFAVDIFACGVCLFMLASGKIPFQSANREDPWYKYVGQERYERFWSKMGWPSPEEEEGIEELQDLFIQTVKYQPRERITVDTALAHPWMQGEIYEDAELITQMRELFHQTVHAMRTDADRLARLNNSSIQRRERDVDGQDLEPPLISEFIPPYTGYTIDEDDSVNAVYESIVAMFKGIETATEPEFTEDMSQFFFNIKLPFAEFGGQALEYEFRIVKKEGVNEPIVWFTKQPQVPNREHMEFLKTWFIENILTPSTLLFDSPFFDEEEALEEDDYWESDNEEEPADAVVG